MKKESTQETPWQRMKRKSFEAGQKAGYKEAFDKWMDGKVDTVEIFSRNLVRSLEGKLDDDIFSGAGASLETAGLRQDVR